MIRTLFGAMRRDVRDAVRSLRHTPAFTVTAVLILGLGIGFATAMFTVFQQVVIHRLPVQDQDQLIELSGMAPGAARELPISGDQYKVFTREQRTLQSAAGFAHWGAPESAVLDGDRLLSLHHAVVTGNFFDVLGAAPYLGRLLLPSDETEYAPTHVSGDALVAVISYDTWQRQFGGDISVIGRRVRLPEVKWNPLIVGVAPPGLDYPRGVQLWTPNAYTGGMDVVARLARGSTINAARADYLAFMRQDPWLVKQGLAAQVGARAEPLTKMVLGDARAALVALTVAVGLLLLLGCVNIGNLVLLRASGRRRELAVRRALGAGSGDIIRQLGAESAVLGAAGGVLGLGLSWWLLALLVRMAPAGLPRLDMIRVAPAPVLVAAAVSLVAVILFGLSPAVAASMTNPSPQLRADARSGSDTRASRTFRRGLVASQLALALMLLAGAGLLIRSFVRLSGLDLGFPTAHLSSVGVAMPWQKWVVECGTTPPEADTVSTKRFARCVDGRIYDFHDALTAAFHTLPGVEKVSSLVVRPFLGSNVWMAQVRAVDQTDDEAAKNPWVGMDFVGSEYFDAMGLTILKGRAFTDADRGNAPFVAILSEGVARHLWPGKDPIGMQVRMVTGSPALLTVVGLVQDIHFREHRVPTPMIFRPYRQEGAAQGAFVIRTSGPLPTFTTLRHLVRSTDPDAELVEAATMDEVIAPQIAQPRLNAWLLTVFGFVAILLAAIGLYGIVASVVTNQTREIGVRMALGATAHNVRAMILRQALTVAGAGALCGLVGALAGSRLLRSMLFEVSPNDPVALAGASLVLLAVALVAAYLPARRATAIDPAIALRSE